MIKNKLFVILATVVLLIMAACEGGFVEPGTLSSISGPNSGLTGGGVTGAGNPALGGGGGSGGIGGIGGGSSGDGGGGGSSGGGSSGSSGGSQGGSSNTGSGSESNPIPLTPGIWVNGNANSYNAVWYSFNVTSGNTYYVWWNDSYEGNGTKNGDIRVTASLNGSIISSSYQNNSISFPFSNHDSAWDYPKYFTASSSGTVKLAVNAVGSNFVGSFGIVYSTSSSRPTP